MIDGAALMQAASAMTADLEAGLDPAQVLQHTDAANWLERAGRNNKLILATRWADCYPVESIDPYQLDLPGGDRPIQPGGDGTPAMARFPVSEYAVHLHKSTGSAERIIADGLDLRHRLPRLWQRLCSYDADGLDCQTVARRTHHLTLDQALHVDAEVTPYVGNWSWGRMSDFLDATIMKVDAVNMARRAEEAKRERGVWPGQSNDHGVKSVYLRLEAAAAIFFDAQVQRLADILARRGHLGTNDQRRADAVAELTNPYRAIRLIAEDTEPTLFDPDPDDDSLLIPPAGTRPDLESPTADDGESFSTRDSDPSDTTSADDDSPSPGQQADDDPAEANPPAPGTPASTVDELCESGLVRSPRLDPDRRLAEAAIRAIRQLDPTTFLPNATLYVHIALETLNDQLGVTRVEDVGPVISTLVADWLKDCRVTIKPVIDLNHDLDPVDAYEIPAKMRERMFLKRPGSVFPYSGSIGRHLDLDHSIPYTPGIPGQTHEDGLGPHGRREHNVITHAHGWRRRQPWPGMFLFRAPHGTVILVTPTGSHDLGRGTFAQALWHATTPRVDGTDGAD